MRVRLTDVAAFATMDRKANEFSLCEGSRSAPRRHFVRHICFFSLIRIGTEDLGHIAARPGSGVLEDDLGERDGTEVATRAPVGSPGRRSGFC